METQKLTSAERQKQGKWVFTGCIIFSFLLLAWEARKSRAIIKSRDISCELSAFLLPPPRFGLGGLLGGCGRCSVRREGVRNDGKGAGRRKTEGGRIAR